MFFLVEQRLYYTWYKLEILFILINSNPVDQTPWIRKRITVGVTLWNLAVPTLRGLLILHLLLVLSRVYRRSPAGSRTRTVDHLVLRTLVEFSPPVKTSLQIRVELLLSITIFKMFPECYTSCSVLLFKRFFISWVIKSLLGGTKKTLSLYRMKYKYVDDDLLFTPQL